jgi:hypothetical protein
MDTICGATRVEFISEDGKSLGSIYGLIMSYYDQTIIFTPFNINKNHFTHSKNAITHINNKIIKLDQSRYSHPFLLRVWTLALGISINPSSELTINCPKKNHNILGSTNTIDEIEDISINFWHRTLPPFYAHVINNTYEIGTIIHFNNKPSGIIVSHLEKKSIIVNTFTLKQIASGLDFYYSGIYYKLKLSVNNEVYVAEDWDLYENSLKKNDILLEINDTPVNVEDMYYSKLSKSLYIDTWITMMYMDINNNNLECKILRDNKIMNINIPRKPLMNLMQIPYYADEPDAISFEKMHVLNYIERYDSIARKLRDSPKLLFI